VQGNGNRRGAARTRWLKLDSADSAPTPKRTGTGQAAGVNGSMTGIETNHWFEGTFLIAGQSENSGCCCFALSHHTSCSRLGKWMCKKLVAARFSLAGINGTWLTRVVVIARRGFNNGPPSHFPFLKAHTDEHSTGSLGFGLPITPHPTTCSGGWQMESDHGLLAGPWDLR